MPGVGRVLGVWGGRSPSRKTIEGVHLVVYGTTMDLCLVEEHEVGGSCMSSSVFVFIFCGVFC